MGNSAIERQERAIGEERSEGREGMKVGKNKVCKSRVLVVVVVVVTVVVVVVVVVVITVQ